MKKPALTFLILLLAAKSLMAAEADHYSFLDTSSLIDSNAMIASRTSVLVEKELDALNSKGSCEQMEEKELYKSLQNVFANHSKGKLVKEILYGEEFSLIKIPLKESIYGTWKVRNGYLLGKKSAAQSPLALSPLIQLGERVMGVDKLEHLFGMGYQYFDRFYLRGHSLKRVLKRGIFFEKTILGGNILATGVFAYADLAANFNGMRFWNHVLQKRDDVLGKEHNLGPYVKCQDGEWKQVKRIDFSAYLDESADESINCSKFASKDGFRKYVGFLEDNNLACPMAPQKLKEMISKYNVPTPGDSKKRPISHWILNKVGNGKISYFNEF